VKRLVGLVFALLIASVAEHAGAQAPIVIKFSHVMGADTVKGRAAQAFKELAEARTRGRVRVDVYPSDVLYGDKNELEALQLGAVQMLAPALSNFRALGLREFELFDLPYLFDSYADLHRVTEGPAGVALLQRLEAKGIHGLAYWDVGFKQMTANRALRTPTDFAGLRMRIKSSTVIDAQMRALSAVPVTLPYSETVHALETGMVDGTEVSVSSFAVQHMEREQRYLTLSAHGYIGYAVVVNRRFWERLPADIRSELESAMREVTRQQNAAAEARDKEALAALRRSGGTTVIDLTEQEKAAWKRALQPVREGLDPLSRELIDGIRDGATPAS
jgi:C4-dicarboxylate-binding protein DctP